MNTNQRINQLLSQTRGLSSTNLEGTALIERLRKEAFALSAWACREIDRITAERDEARREVCELLCNPPERLVEGICALPEECADIRQWDCFKDIPTGNA